MDYNLNGRVNILSKTKSNFDYTNCSTDSSDGYDIVSRDFEHTPVSSVFFSKMNIDALQKGISNRVFNDSNGKYNIGRQSETELKIIMRSFYFNSLSGSVPNFLQDIVYGNPSEKDYVISQVRSLNSSVLDWSVPRILTNIQQFEKYKSDVSGLPMPLDRPSFLSTAGTKSLELQSFF